MTDMLTALQAALGLQKTAIPFTAEGALRTCLFANEETDLRTPLRTGASDLELETIIRNAVLNKRMKHEIGEPGFVHSDKSMSQIGG